MDAEENFQLTDIQCEICAKSTDCITCKAARSSSSIEEMEQDVTIRNAIKKNKQQDGSIKLCLEYPIKKELDLAYLYSASKANSKMARMSSESLRKKLIREGKLEAFNSKVWEGVDKGQYVIVDKEVQEQHQDEPVSYQLINYIIKDTSASTKLRVVTNSSVERSGGSFNDACIQGSNMLNSSFDVLNRFSAYPFAFLTDISEAYRSVDTGPRTNSCRRFYWYEDPANESNAVELMLKVMTFGDRPAANILAQSVNMVAEDEEVSAE